LCRKQEPDKTIATLHILQNHVNIMVEVKLCCQITVYKLNKQNIDPKYDAPSGFKYKRRFFFSDSLNNWCIWFI